MFIFREACESLPGAAPGSSPLVGRDLPARKAGEVLPGSAPGKLSRASRKIEHLFSRKLKKTGRRLTLHMKARRVRLLLSMTEVDNRLDFPRRRQRCCCVVDWLFEEKNAVSHV